MQAAPFVTFGNWLAEAEASEPNDPNAMILATSTMAGMPAARAVLLKAWDEAGFVFYTNLESRKSEELRENANAALLFHWKSLRRQIRIEGAVSLVTEGEADDYFASRPRGARIGAWASAQSRPLPDRATFETKIAEFESKFPEAATPRPPNWSGWRLRPSYFEFWQDRHNRLHERTVFAREGEGWRTGMLYP